MRHSPAMAHRALALAGDLNESAYRRHAKFHETCKANESGGFPASTIHGGGRASGISDPTGTQAINPEADPARFDLHQAYADLLQATRLLGQVEEAVCAALGGLPLSGLRLRVLRTPGDATEALDLGGYLIERLEGRFEAFHRAASGLDRGEAYNDLDQALRLLSAVDDVMCRWLGGDPVRVLCANGGCPDRPNPPALGRYRCWACDQWLRRHGGEERTRVAEKAETALEPRLPGEAPQMPQDRLGPVGCGMGGPTPPEATGPHAGWLIPGLDTYGYDPQSVDVLNPPTTREKAS